ncbi:polyprenol phosphomannose-dependent alpha 1,6 mannosyltransferase MptB [Frankia sp. AiPa1]|nr:polyprenol phosphomannose-dependent alpha 1,6 mannosyltransferase MptB [Frankia sp. AiPa1]
MTPRMPTATPTATPTAAPTRPRPTTKRAPVGVFRLVIAGAIAAVTAMVTEGRLGPRDPNVTDPTSWWGILPSAPPGETTRGVLAGLSALGVIALCLCWAALVLAMLAGRVTTRTGLVAAFVWTLPFAVGPPLFSRDVHAYAGQGELARLGLDPATHGIATLLTSGAADGSGPTFVRAVDPRWTLTHSPYGGAAVALEKAAAVVGGGPAGTVVALRVLAVIAVLGLILGSLLLAGRAPGRRAAVAVLVAANPVVAIHLVGGAHLDASAAALVVAALLLDRAGAQQGQTATARLGTATAPAPEAAGDTTVDPQRRTGLVASRAARWRPIVAGAGATGLAALAANVKATVLPVVVWLLVAHLLLARRSAHPGRAGAVRLVVDVMAVAVATVLSSLAAGFGPTWIHALSTSGALSTGIAPASLLAYAADPLLDLVGIHPVTAVTLRVTRGLCLVAAAVALVLLVVRAWRHTTSTTTSTTGFGRSTPTLARPDLAVIGYGGLAVALANPVVYPWYLATCLPALAILAAMFAEPAAPAASPGAVTTLAREPVRMTDRPRFVASRVMGWTLWGTVVVSVWLCLATLSPLAATWHLLGAGGLAALAVIMLLALAGAGRAVVSARRRPAAPTSTS